MAIPPVKPRTLAAFPCRIEAPEGPESRVREFVASTELVASDRGIIRAAGWRFTRYAGNPAFLWAHNRTAPPIGKTTGWRVDLERKELRLRVEFAPADSPSGPRTTRPGGRSPALGEVASRAPGPHRAGRTAGHRA